MGGSYSAPPPESTSATLGAYSNYLPQLLQETANGIPQIAQGTLQATQQTQPGYNQLNLNQLQDFALPEAQIGQQVANSNAQAGAATNLQQIQGAGGQAAAAGTALMDQLSPAYAAAQKGAAEGVNAINLNGLSPGESNATERSLNQSNVGSGNLGLLNPTNTISNALNFGGAFNSKVGLLNNATNTATNAASAGGFSPVNLALGQPQPSTASNFGTGQFGNASSTTSAGSAGNAFNFGNGLLNNITSSNNSLISAGTQNSIANSPVAYLGNTCCFIFLEAYYGNIPKHVRSFRDKVYYKNKDVATGYRRMAKWLVPLMQRYGLVRTVVWNLMIKPITNNCISLNVMPQARTITHMWLKFWAWYGKGKDYGSYDMEWTYPGRRSI